MQYSADHYTDVANVYYNAQMYNNTDRDQIATYETIATSTVLEHPEQYAMTISAFSIPSDDIPLFLFQNNTYSVTLYQPASGAVNQVYLSYINREPSDTRQPVYSFDHMVQMVNVALESAFTGMSGTSGSPPSNEPIMVYDNSSGRFSLIVDNGWGHSWHVARLGSIDRDGDGISL